MGIKILQYDRATNVSNKVDMPLFTKHFVRRRLRAKFQTNRLTFIAISLLHCTDELDNDYNLQINDTIYGHSI